jgi:hypothetical protein
MYGISINSEFWQNNYREKRLPFAREVLLKFPIINGIFENFKGYDGKLVGDARNFIFLQASPKIDGSLGITSVKWLKSVEEALSLLDFENWSAKSKGRFLTRFTSDDYFKSISPSSELLLARRMVDRFGKDDVEIWPGIDSGGESDLKVNFGGRDVFIEVGNLSHSLPEQKLQSILDASSNQIIKILNKGYNVLTVCTSEFVFDKEKIDVDSSISKICSEVERLKLGGLIGYAGGLDFSQLAYVVGNEQLLKDLGNLTHGFDDEFKLMENEPGKSWLASCREELAKGSRLLTDFVRSDSKNNVVEVHTESFFPSPAALAEQKSFIGHVKRHIDGQLHQIQPGNCNIIYVQGDNWILFGLLDEIGENPLYGEVKTYLKEKRIPVLNGVAIVRADFDHPVFVYNDVCDQSVCFTREQLEQLGFQVIV